MTIKKGIAVKTIAYEDGFVDTTKVEIIEKTQGNYTEVLARKTVEVYDGNAGAILSSDTESAYTVYACSTVSEALTKKGISGTYSWEESLAEV